MTPELVAHPEDLVTERTSTAEQLCKDFFDDVWARGNADACRRYLSEDFAYNPPPGYAGDRAGYQKLVADIHRALPDLFADLEGVVGSGGEVAARWFVEGTFENAFMGVPPNGRRVRIEGISWDCVRGGRIWQETAYSDDLAFLAQLGVTDLSELGA